MRVMILTMSDQLEFILSVLNPQIEVCSIIVDEVEQSKGILKGHGLNESLLSPLYELKECLENIYCDCVLCFTIGWDNLIAMNQFRKDYRIPYGKFINFHAMNTPYHFMMKNVLKYYSDHSSDFDMIATGISYTAVALDSTKFKRKLFNFARASQDLYYDYRTAKFAVSRGGGHL